MRFGGGSLGVECGVIAIELHIPLILLSFVYVCPYSVVRPQDARGSAEVHVYVLKIQVR